MKFGNLAAGLAAGYMASRDRGKKPAETTPAPIVESQPSYVAPAADEVGMANGGMVGGRKNYKKGCR